MALDDAVFYNLKGELIGRNALVNEMIKYYNLKLEVGETKVTDFNEGSEIRNILEAIAVDVYVMMEEENELTKIAFIDSATGEWLDKHGANPLINLPRKTGTEAMGFVTFSIPHAITTEVIIPVNTLVVSEENGLEYTTNAQGIIPVGETEVTVGATCITTGYDGNCSAGTINSIQDEYLDDVTLSVTNEDAFFNGEDYELDDDYRKRLLAHKQKPTFGSKPYYIELAESVDGVHDVQIVDDTDYTANVKVNGYTRPTPDSVVVNVLAKLSEPENIVLGHVFTASKPTFTTLNLDINLEVYTEIQESLITNIVTDFVHGGSHEEGFELQGLDIGQGFTRRDIYSLINIIAAVKSVTIKKHGEETEIDVIDCDPGKALRIANLYITQTVVE